MSDSADKYREVSEGLTFQVGDSVVAYTYPLTEGLIIDKRVSEEGRLELMLLTALYKKKGKSWSKTTVRVRDAARLSKKPLARFLFPIKGVDQLRVEARRAKGDPTWADIAKGALNKDFQQAESSLGCSASEQKDEEDYTEPHGELEVLTKKRRDDDGMTEKVRELERRMKEVLQITGRKDEKRKGSVKKKKKGRVEEVSDYEEWRKSKRSRERKKGGRSRKKKSRSSSSSSSSSSSLSSSSSNEERAKREVGEKGNSGLFSCPFHRSDTRGFSDARCQIQGQSGSRRHLRMALHNLYGAHHTLVAFVDKFVPRAYSSPYKPFTIDVTWLQALAEFLDTLLLNSLEGSWSSWNEPVVDQLATGFLELMMRVSPYKDYPVCFEDSVRKWMKKMRIGMNVKFGLVSYAMQHAKFTEGGVVLQGVQRNKERTTSMVKQGSGNFNKNNSYASSGGEKRASPLS